MKYLLALGLVGMARGSSGSACPKTVTANFFGANEPWNYVVRIEGTSSYDPPITMCHGDTLEVTGSVFDNHPLQIWRGDTSVHQNAGTVTLYEGTYTYKCERHPLMNAQITVKSSSDPQCACAVQPPPHVEQPVDGTVSIPHETPTTGVLCTNVSACNYNKSWYIGPSYKQPAQNPFQQVFVGQHGNGAPAFVDTDNDGDMDLVMGWSRGLLNYYENTGNASNPFYTSREGAVNPFDGVADVGDDSVPAFVDVDNDGDMDLVIGRNAGDLHYYENTGNASNPLYTRREGALNPFDAVEDVGTRSVPAFVDTDNDGDMDLVVGKANGDLDYYENTGSASNPSYTKRDWERNPVREVYDVPSKSAPAFVDADNDGDMDLVVGEQEGDLYYYENTGNATHASYTIKEGLLNPFDGIDVGRYSKPAFVDVDNDGDMDLVIGHSDGTLEFYEILDWCAYTDGTTSCEDLEAIYMPAPVTPSHLCDSHTCLSGFTKRDTLPETLGTFPVKKCCRPLKKGCMTQGKANYDSTAEIAGLCFDAYKSASQKVDDFAGKITFLEKRGVHKQHAKEDFYKKRAEGLTKKMATREARATVLEADLSEKVKKRARGVVKVAIAINSGEDSCELGVTDDNCGSIDLAGDRADNETTILTTEDADGSWAVVVDGSDIIVKQTKKSDGTFDMQCWDGSWNATTNYDVSNDTLVKTHTCHDRVFLLGSVQLACDANTCPDGCGDDGLCSTTDAEATEDTSSTNTTDCDAIRDTGNATAFIEGQCCKNC